MNILFDPRVEKWLRKLSNQDKAQISEYIQLFIEFGFNLDKKYLSKVGVNLWELRPGRYRIFFIKINPNYIVIHVMTKKSQKITKETKKLLQQRMKEYI